MFLKCNLSKLLFVCLVFVFCCCLWGFCLFFLLCVGFVLWVFFFFVVVFFFFFLFRVSFCGFVFWGVVVVSP